VGFEPGRSAKLPAEQAGFHSSIEEQLFPESVRLLRQADDALSAKQYDAALSAARSASASLEKEYAQHANPDVALQEAYQRLGLQQWYLEGSALRALGKDVEALLALKNLTFEALNCRIDLRPKCREYADWLGQTFPSIVRSTTFVALSPATPVPLTHDLSDLDMDMNEHEILANKGWVAVRIQPTSSKSDKDAVMLRVDGSTTIDSYEECQKIGEVRIGERDFDMKRCGEHEYTAHRVDFFATVPAADAARLTGAAGEEVLIVFDTKTWKRNGKVYTSGPARVAYVTPPRAK
jgi:hypothetical protein